jgi:hypothetical protein
MAYVYRHIRLDKNEPFYIGIGSDEKNYLRAKNKHSRNKFWKNIVSKTDYEIEIILDNVTLDEAVQKEIEFIALYKRRLDGGTLVNLTSGGEGQSGFTKDEEERLRIKKRAIKRWANPAFKEMMKAKLKGRKLPPVSEEKKKKQSLNTKGRIGKPLTEETKQKLRLHNLGKKHSEETKLKCREATLKMWADKNKAEEIKKAMIGKQLRCKINDK